MSSSHNAKVYHLISELRTALQDECHAHCTSVNIHINSSGYDIEYNLRSPGSLKRDGISMRNINGTFIT